MPPVAMAAKSWRSWPLNGAGVLLGLRHQPREQAVGQQADVLGEQAEEQADQEVGGRVRVGAVLAQELRPGGRTRVRGLLGDLLGGLPRAQARPGR